MSDHTMPDLDLGITSRWTAGVRARESQRADRLFDDPWAASLAGNVGMDWVAQRPESSSIAIVLRTRYYDDFLRRIVYRNGIRQIVLVAAGLDTRAFRLSWPEDTVIYELDQPGVLNYKEQVLLSQQVQPACQRRSLGVDLTAAWKDQLLAVGFNPLASSGWLMEGFLFYLPVEAIERILRTASGLAYAGSWLGFDIINQEVLKSPYTKAWVDMQASLGAPWIGYLDDPRAFLREQGWTAELTQAGAPDATCPRWSLPVIPVEMPGMPHNWLVTAQKSPARQV